MNTPNRFSRLSLLRGVPFALVLGAAAGCAGEDFDDPSKISGESVTLSPANIGTFPAGEGSGAVESRKYPGVVWAHRDGGSATADKPRAALYAYKVQGGKLVDITPGAKFKAINIPGTSNQQWEDIGADDAGNLWIGQIGSCATCEHYLLKIKEPDPTKDTSAEVLAKYTYAYPGSFSNSESLFIFENSPYLITKASPSVVYRMTTLQTGGKVNVLKKIGALPSNGGANLSGADISRDKKRFVVGAHNTTFVYESSNPKLTGEAYVTDLISRAPKYSITHNIGGVEGIAFVGGGYDITLLSENKAIHHLPATLYSPKATSPTPEPPPPPPAPPPPATYPGYVAPGSLLFGAAIGGNGDPAVHEDPAGRPLTVHRTFFQWDKRATSMVSMAKDDLVNKRVPWVSVKPPSWAEMAAGTHDAAIDDMLKALAALNGPVWLTIHHEPEGGGASGNTPDDSAGPAGHLAMNERVRQRMTALKTSTIALAPILMSYTWQSVSGRNPESWWKPGVYDFLGIDHYQDSESTLVNNAWATVRTWAKAKGVEIAVGEWGMRGTDAAAGQRLREWYNSAAGSNVDGKGARVMGLAAFDSALNAPTGSWELKGEQLTTFHALLSDPHTANAVK